MSVISNKGEVIGALSLRDGCAVGPNTRQSSGLLKSRAYDGGRPTEAESVAVTPEPAKASQDTLTAPTDGAPVGKKNELEDQILSIQSVIASLLKRS